MNVVLNSFGASIRRSNSVFEISTAAGNQSLHPRDIKTITVSKGARISSYAVLMAIEHEIDVLFVDKIGNPQGRVWSVKYGSISDIRKHQIEFLYSSKSVDWVKNIIIKKLNNQVAMLLSLKGNDDRLNRIIQAAINSLEDYTRKIRSIDGEGISDIAPSLRGWEGAAAKKYFKVISEYLPDNYKFDKRSKNPAIDEFNSMLNYGYGILYGKVEGALIKAGIDPYVGIFHRDDYNRPALVYDVIEKYRIWIDFVVIHLCKQNAMIEECFKQEGNALLLDGLGKRILIQSVNDYLAEIIPLNGLERSRNEHLNIYGHQLASEFLNFKL